MRKKEIFDNETFLRPVNRSSSDAILASLYRKILKDLNVTNMAFETMMENFLKDPKNGIPTNIKERSSARGNLRKELLRDHMTWKVFCKGLRFLNVPRFHIAVCLDHLNGKQTFHENTVVLDDLVIEAEFTKGPEEEVKLQNPVKAVVQTELVRHLQRKTVEYERAKKAVVEPDGGFVHRSRRSIRS